MVFIDCYAPTAKGPHPAVLLLAGAAGEDQVLRKIGKNLAEGGYVALAPNISQAETEDIDTSFAAVRGVIEFAVSRKDVDPERLGMFGYSKGAYLAGYLGSRDPRVKAVVRCEGPVIAAVNKLPPATFLIQAGEGNTSAEVLAEYVGLLKAKGVEVWVHIYPGADHNLTDRHMIDAGRRSGVFFDQFLKGPKKEPDPKVDAKPVAPKRKEARIVPEPLQDRP
jgi:dienelactone hydrolase